MNGITSPLSEFLAQVSSQSNQSLGSLLVTPIQRIPRYQLLIQDLIKHTPDELNELDTLELALDEVISLAKAVDQSSLRQIESGFKLKNVLDNFHPRYQTGLYVPGREIIAKVCSFLLSSLLFSSLLFSIFSSLLDLLFSSRSP